MPLATSGGASNIDSSKIVDGTIINADVADAAAIDQSKIRGTNHGNDDLIAVDTTTTATLSLTTVANQKVVVMAKGTARPSGGNYSATVLLNYNSVEKDRTVGQDSDNNNNRDHDFALLTVLEPGAATANITVTSADATLTNVVITVIKVKGTT